MKKLFLLPVLVVIAGCGGGGGGNVSGGSTDFGVSITGVTTEKVMYSVASTIAVNGSNLDQGISLAASGACSSLTEQAGGTATKRIYSCTPTSVGAINVTVSRNGETLKTAAITVPNPQVTMVTGKGTVVVELNPAKAPISVNNFLTYVHESFYNNTIFHRVVPDFVVQGGGFSTSGTQKTTHTAITLEPTSLTGLSNTVGTIAMARTAGLNSATSQFFINTVNNNPNTTISYKNTNLDLPAGEGYAVFGAVVSGLNVVKTIESTPIADTALVSSYVVLTTMTQTQ